MNNNERSEPKDKTEVEPPDLLTYSPQTRIIVYLKPKTVGGEIEVRRGRVVNSESQMNLSNGKTIPALEIVVEGTSEVGEIPSCPESLLNGSKPKCWFIETYHTKISRKRIAYAQPYNY